jgi:hypothetical protein
LSNTGTLLALEKLGKAAANTIAEATAIQSVNQDLVDTTKEKEKRKQQNREDSIDSSYTRVISREELLYQREFGTDKKFEAILKEFSYTAFGVVILYNITAKDKSINLDLLQSQLRNLLEGIFDTVNSSSNRSSNRSSKNNTKWEDSKEKNTRLEQGVGQALISILVAQLI